MQKSRQALGQKAQLTHPPTKFRTLLPPTKKVLAQLNQSEKKYLPAFEVELFPRQAVSAFALHT